MRTAATAIAAAAPSQQTAAGADRLVADRAAVHLGGRLFVVAPTLIMLVYSFCERGTLGGVVFTLHAGRTTPRVFDRTYLQIIVRSICSPG